MIQLSLLPSLGGVLGVRVDTGGRFGGHRSGRWSGGLAYPQHPIRSSAGRAAHQYRAVSAGSDFRSRRAPGDDRGGPGVHRSKTGEGLAGTAIRQCADPPAAACRGAIGVVRANDRRGWAGAALFVRTSNAGRQRRRHSRPGGLYDGADHLSRDSNASGYRGGSGVGARRRQNARCRRASL